MASKQSNQPTRDRTEHTLMRMTSPQVERKGGAYNEDTMVHDGPWITGGKECSVALHVHGSGKIDKV